MNGSVSQERILIVDDTTANINILVAALREQYKLAVATSGTKALELVEKQPPDLVLLDIMMPEMDGYEVCAWLKERPHTRGIPVIFITALSEIAEKTRGFALGAVDYITKPFEVAEVQIRVRTHLQLERYRRELEAQNRILRQTQAQLRHQVRELQGRDRLLHAQMNVANGKQAAEAILQAVEQTLAVDLGAVYQVGEDGESLQLVGGRPAGIHPALVDARDPQSLTLRAFKELELQLDDQGAAAVPLLYRRRPVGALWVQGMKGEQVDQQTLTSTLRSLAAEAALVLHAARMNEFLGGDLEGFEANLQALLVPADEEEPVAVEDGGDESIEVDVGGENWLG